MIMHVGTKVLALLALVALAACTDATGSASRYSDSSSAPSPVASADNDTSVNKVSDALGQRLDGMLSGRQAGAPVSR